MSKPTLEIVLDQEAEFQAVSAAAGETIEITMESLMSFGSFLGSLSDSLIKAGKAIINYHETADMMRPYPAGSLATDLDNAGFSTVRNIQVHRIPKMTAPLSEFLKELNSQLDDFGNIGSTLYKPTDFWLARVVNDPDLLEKPWISRDLKFNDLKRNGRALQEFYAPTGRRTDDSELTDFINVFPTIKDFRETERLITDTHEKLSQISLDDIKELETSIIKRMKKLMELDEDPEEEFELNRANKVQLAKVFRSLALETEYLVAILFQGNQALGAWNNSVDALKQKIK